MTNTSPSLPDTLSPFAPSEFPAIPRIAGVETRAVACGARYKGRDDLLLVSLTAGGCCAGVFTKSSAAAAPVLWSQRALSATSETRAILVNAGQANALTGSAGEEFCKLTGARVAALTGVGEDQVLLASTGVIGENPPSTTILDALPSLAASPACDWERAARAFATTDSFAKGAFETTEIEGTPLVVAGIAKGAGMIAPNMATMLAVVATDAALDASVLQALLRSATTRTFNAVSIDGDMSTNDTVFALASGASNDKPSGASNDKPSGASAYKPSGASIYKPLTSLDDARGQAFYAAFVRVLRSLARQIAMDGEGIGKFITLWTKGASSEEQARRVGLSVLSSPLVKIALAYGDSNWGRIAMAIGKTGVPVCWDKASIAFGEHAEHAVFEKDAPVLLSAEREKDLARLMSEQRITITIDLAIGDAAPVETWGCDLTHEYLRLNGDYRS